MKYKLSVDHGFVNLKDKKDPYLKKEYLILRYRDALLLFNIKDMQDKFSKEEYRFNKNAQRRKRFIVSSAQFTASFDNLLYINPKLLEEANIKDYAYFNGDKNYFILTHKELEKDYKYDFRAKL